MNKRLKNILLIILFFTIIGMGIGYAALAQLLTINGTANITGSWDVRISNIQEENLTGATPKVATVVAGDKLSATFDVNLQYPGASATYRVTVQNAGTIDARLESIVGVQNANSLEPTEIEYTIDAKENDRLNNGDTKDYIVTVRWKDSNSIPETKSKSATITLNYIQDV